MAAVVFTDAHVKGKVIVHVPQGSAIPDTRPAKVIADTKATATGPQVILFVSRLLGNQ